MQPDQRQRGHFHASATRRGATMGPWNMVRPWRTTLLSLEARGGTIAERPRRTSSDAVDRRLTIRSTIRYGAAPPLLCVAALS
jgi:hypothetical protein